MDFIGHHLVQKLLKEGYEVLVIDNIEKKPSSPLENHPHLEIIFKDILEVPFPVYSGVDIVFHLAAKIGGIKYFHKYPATILPANSALTHRVLHNCWVTGVPRIVYISSSMVFERATKFPTPEDHIDKCPPPVSAYGFSKLLGEVACKAYFEQYGLKYVICRPFNAYGPGEAPEDDPGMAHLIPDLIKKILDRQNPLEIFGDGLQRRCYTHVEDVVDGIFTAGTGMHVNEAFNISTSVESTVLEVARSVIEAIYGGSNFQDIRIKHLPSFEHDIRRRFPDTGKMKRIYGWSANTPLEEGIMKTCEWYKTNRSSLGS